MTVQHLKEILDTLDPSMLVVLSKDSEGNRYSPLVGHEVMNYVPERRWVGMVYDPELTPELEADGYTEDDVYNDVDAVPAVILWPTY